MKKIKKSSIIKSIKDISRILAITAASCIITTTTEAKDHFFLSFGWGYEQPLTKNVQSFPLIIRDVPIHKDDDYAPRDNAGPIENRPVKMPNRFYPRATFGTSIIPSNEIKLNLGINLDVPFSIKADFSERNYTNHIGTEQRGRGAALTYYAIHENYGPLNIFFRPTLFSELELKIARKASITFGSEILESKLDAENGWDRYDGYEKWKEFKLAEMVALRSYLGINTHSENKYTHKLEKYNSFIKIGFQKIINKKETEMGKTMNIHYHDNSFFVIAGGSITF
jgi:hypothetical protein